MNIFLCGSAIDLEVSIKKYPVLAAGYHPYRQVVELLRSSTETTIQNGSNTIAATEGEGALQVILCYSFISTY